MLIGQLHPTPPYDFLKSIRAANYHTVLDVIQDDTYWRALRFGADHALIQVTSHGTPDHPQLNVQLMAATGETDPDVLLRKIAHLLGAEADLKPFYSAVASDPVFGPLLEPLHGLRHIRAASLFEALLTTIIEQQIGLRQAQKGERWLVEWADNGIDYEGKRFYTFPTPQQIAAASVDDLKPLKITNRRMQTMIDIATLTTSGALDLDSQDVSTRHTAEIYDQLIALKGIGQWTASWAIIRSTGHYQYIGESDVALQAAVNHYFYNQAGRTTTQVVKETLGRYGDYAGEAAFFTLMRWATDRY